ncbi:helix-turn-helix transcriptional regulator [Heyndrickxia camelliae]|uniref:DNA-binding transcriptional regulator n=1 Tax=Heyndrickxia camelliae TaxID=1707093 RepID=A0A2N3LHV6_9BACI|nr:YafY family protein [Heyndrickxia camelliae]PKR84181.1 DNA-binding transcriptional regulator [Heyndrickxia camelliae]
MSKSDNMLSILWLLKSRKQMTAKQIAEELEISIRTVYRYIDSLCASGVPIVADSGHNGGYRLLEHFHEAPLFFDLEEQKALIHAAKYAKEAGYPFGDALEAAVSKLKFYTNEEQLEKINRHSIGFDVIHSPIHTPKTRTLQLLEEAVANETTLSIEYIKGNGKEQSSRELDPYGLLFWKNKWYAIAFCHLRNEIRSFRVDRIITIEVTDLTFERPSEFSARRFFMNSILPNIQDPAELISVRIQGQTSAIDSLCEHWLLGHVLIERSVHDVHFKLDRDLISFYLPYLILSYGKSIQVKEPIFLKERLISITMDLNNFYQK